MNDDSDFWAVRQVVATFITIASAAVVIGLLTLLVFIGATGCGVAAHTVECTDGCTYIVGEPGPPGEPGPAGSAGSVGINGHDGRPGSNGEPGAPGPEGEQGTEGEPGQEGAQGQPGPAGEDGEPGEIGPAGPPGAAGTDGIDGAQGPQGVAGDPGAVGPAGPVGPQGPSGISTVVLGQGNLADCAHSWTLFSDGILMLEESSHAASASNNLGTWNVYVGVTFSLMIGGAITCSSAKYYTCGPEYRLDYLWSGQPRRILLNSFNPANVYSDRAGISILEEERNVCN